MLCFCALGLSFLYLCALLESLESRRHGTNRYGVCPALSQPVADTIADL